MNDDINHPLAKVGAGAAIYLTIDWLTTAGKVAGALLSVALFSEWVWKRLIKPLLIRTGHIKGKPRDFLDTTVNGDIEP